MQRRTVLPLNYFNTVRQETSISWRPEFLDTQCHGPGDQFPLVFPESGTEPNQPRQVMYYASLHLKFDAFVINLPPTNTPSHNKPGLLGPTSSRKTSK